MESWSNVFDGGILVSDKSMAAGHDEEVLEGGFMESGVLDMLWNSLISSSRADRDDMDDDLIKMLSSSESVKFPSHGELKSTPQSSKVISSYPSMELPLPSKRPRTTTHEEMKRSIANFSSQLAPVCQVHGCNRDLRSSKHYHKKHKVCSEHSKSAQVIVNGTEQRFCQQCSRFHLVAEFDNKKRSCRKRLAEHNERRRKPLNQIHWGAAAWFLDMASSQRLPMPFHFPEELPQMYFCHEIYGTNSSCQIEFRENPICVSEFTREQTLIETLSAQELSAASRKSRHALSLLSAAPTSGKPFGIITSNSFTLHDCNNVDVVHNEADQTQGNYQESGPILDLQQISALLQKVQQQQELASF